VNPQGVEVTSFKVPTEEEMNHGYLWRTSQRAPARGRIGIFNRSYYEEVLVVRVHSEVLANEKLPKSLVTKNIWEERYEDINNFERYVTRNGIAVVKFFLNISKKEQKRRFLERLDTPQKNWKFSASDIKERAFWDDYQVAYEDAIRETASEYAPWYVVPADHKWFTRLVVSQVLVDELKALKLEYPKVSGEKKKALAETRRLLEKE
jgi:PPK2 family polyphosphate:nucleotide phosphotransferase